MKYKALISDLDGTLIPNRLDGMPSQKIISTIAKAKDTIHISIATGRAPWQAKPILDVLQLSGPVILLNGALIIDGATGEILYAQPLLKKDYTTVVAMLRKANYSFIMDDHEKTFAHDSNEQPETPLTILVENLTEPQADMLIKQLSHIPTLSLYKINGWNKGTVGVNISHKLATKQFGIYEAAKILEIETHEIIGIGEGPNDFPLLMACGLKVAMDNAIPDLKAIADYITSSVENDGVAEVIEKFVL